MPRRSRNQQAPVAAPGQPYGEATDQIQAQNVIPLPQKAPPSASGGAPSGPPATGTDANAVDPAMAAIQAALGTPPPSGSLGAPSTRPTEPITAGLSVGPGPGPEVRGPSKALAGTVADTFRMLWELTGNQVYLQMAQQAQQQGV